eukprot:TRINITY_DN4548_c0_g1_i3.p2 TRINITY_DN4548_c0_g1~~TRINITY_DN4548_c0_g1_i3.p2  ORF type:complete len:124 (+),score=33.86 TRINITY_DN4548_c0_g1_i3:93-464(+)
MASPRKTIINLKGVLDKWKQQYQSNTVVNNNGNGNGGDNSSSNASTMTVTSPVVQSKIKNDNENNDKDEQIIDQKSSRIEFKEFPFDPYEIQQQFMDNLYRTLEDGGVGIFESPTGTGKVRCR